MAFPTGWLRRCAITVDRTKVGSGGVSDFTVLLTRTNFPSDICSPTGSRAAQVDAGDVRFTSDAVGATPLACAIDEFEHDSSDGAFDAVVRMHVKVPALASASDTTFYVWYHATTEQAQPARTAPYGIKDAWDASHCHRWSLDEDPTGSAPQYVDSVGDRHATATGSVTRVTGQDGGRAIDGGASGYVVAPATGFINPNNAAVVPLTGTGICYIPSDDRLAISNFDDSAIVEVNKTTGAQISSFSTAAHVTSLQGLAWNSAASRFAVISSSGSTIYLFQRDGTFDRSFSFSGGTNGLAYDSALDCYWVITSSTSVRSISTSTGATLATVALAAGVAIEGISYNATSDTLFITTDAGFMVYEVNKTSGATIRSFRGPFEIEHPCYDHGSGVLWICADARFHAAATSGENCTYKLNPTTGQPWAWRSPTAEFSVEFWWKPDTVGATQVPFSNFAAVELDALFLELQVRSSGILRAYESDVTFAASAAATFTTGTYQHVRVTYDAGAATLTAFRNNVQVAQNTAAVFTPGPDGRIGIGARPVGTFPHDGAIDEVRVHLAARTSAWWDTRYNNASAPATFAAAGTPVETTAAARRVFVRR